MKKKILIILTILVVIITSSIIIINLTKNNSKERIIHYTSGFSEYTIKEKKNKLQVYKYDIVECVTTPCDPVFDSKFKVEYKNEYKKLINVLFENKDSKEITINENVLNDEQIKILSEIIREDKK